MAQDSRFPTDDFARRNAQQVERRLKMLEEAMTRTPKREPIPPATTGVVGMAELVSTSGTVLMPGGGGNLDYESVTYGTPFDPNSGTDGESTEPISSWLTVSGYQITPSAGWYIPVLYFRLVWNSQANAPAAFGPYIQGGDDSVHNDYPLLPGTAYTGGKWAMVHIANHGPTYMDGSTSFHAEVRPIGSVGGDSNASQSALLWDITKLA